MIPVDQAILHDPDNGKHGDCFSAVIASLLHLDIKDVPLFITATWWRDVNTFLRPYGLAYLPMVSSDIDFIRDELGVTGLYHEMDGYTKRSSEVLHSCVAVDGNVVHDPHPDKTGIVNIERLGLFIALRPWEAKSKEV